MQHRIDRAIDVCEKLGATQMVLHSPYDNWDQANLDNRPADRRPFLRVCAGAELVNQHERPGLCRS